MKVVKIKVDGKPYTHTGIFVGVKIGSDCDYISYWHNNEAWLIGPADLKHIEIIDGMEIDDSEIADTIFKALENKPKQTIVNQHKNLKEVFGTDVTHVKLEMDFE